MAGIVQTKKGQHPQTKLNNVKNIEDFRWSISLFTAGV